MKIINKVVSLVMFVMITVSVVSPLTMHGQEVFEDIKQEQTQKREGNVNKEEKAATGAKYAKNIAYGCSDDSCDNATDIVQIDKTIMEDIEYKVVANTHEIIVRVDLTKEILSDIDTFKMTVTDGTKLKEIAETNTTNFSEIDTTNYIYEIKTGDLISEGFAEGGSYSITFTNGSDTIEIAADNDGNEIALTSMKINVPLVVKYDEGTPLVTSDDVTYSLIGDGINSDTDTDKVSDVEKAEPSTVEVSTMDSTKEAYGVYELESIGYEEANSSTTASTLKADWTGGDLTLTKYDHIIRPIDGNYLVAENIDATQSSTKTTADNVGGFGIDGYRPIGQVVGTATGGESVAFTGEITGDIDTIIGDSRDNTYISNIFINQPTLDYVGMIAIGDDAIISNLGMVDPSIEGMSSVAAFVGSAKDSNLTTGEGSILTNLYTVENEDDSTSVKYDIIGHNTNVGGIVGESSSTNIISDDVFKGNIEGVESSLLTGQPSQIYPDKDGYKTFNAIDVRGNGYTTGGVAGAYSYGTINKVYNKGNVLNEGNNAGGIVGAGKEINIYSTYNMGNIKCIDGTASGIFNNSNNDLSKEVYNNLTNSYNTGTIEGSIGGAGIIYDYLLTNVKNVYNKGEIKVDERESTGIMIGGIAGNTANVAGADGTITNAINIGKINGGNVTSGALGGIVGDGTIETANLDIRNTLNVGEIVSDNNLEYYSIANPKYASITNSYVLEGVNDSAKDLNYGTSEVTYVSEVDLNNIDWWKNTLFIDDNGANWNIEAGDAVLPISDSDTTDESNDNDQGMVNLGYYPTVKEVNASGSPTDYEVLEQRENKLPLIAKEINYKIDAMTLDIYLNLSDVEILTRDGIDAKVKVYENGTMLVNSGITVGDATLVEGDKVIKLTNTGGIKQDTTYKVDVVDGTEAQNLVATVTIHTPKQVTKDGTTYALIGDGINPKTDVNDLIGSDKVNPTTTSGVYGIYELESIGYEEANSLTTASTSKANWGANDLTLTKYDHIIRPIDGNYLVANNIDGMQSSTVTTADNVGGFGIDGYRPIGQMVGTTTGKDSIAFAGILTGDIDTIIGDSRDNTYISKLMINETTLENIGVISLADKATISSLGIVDVSIKGKANVGGIIGRSNNSTLLNLYNMETNNDWNEDESLINYEIQGDSRVGGIVGSIEGSNLTDLSSNQEFNGTIPGIDTSLLVGQPSDIYPDKDGYKTFNTADVKGDYSVGGIVGRSYVAQVKINKTYNKGTIYSENERTDCLVGGIIGGLFADGITKSTITNSYNTGNIVSYGGYEGGIAGIVRTVVSTGTATAQVTNVYNEGKIEQKAIGTYVGGVIGELSGYTVLKNAYNIGNITSNGKGAASGGIVGGGNAAYTADENDAAKVKDSRITNVYNTGNITVNTTAPWVYIDGIMGAYSATATSTEDEYYVTNAINIGNVDVTAPSVIGHDVGPSYTANLMSISNVYTNEATTYKLNGIDQTVEGVFNTALTKTMLDYSWWKNTLFVDDNGANWNINAADADLPTNNTDTTDESEDNANGTVNLGYYPTIKEVDSSDNSTNFEVLEQNLELIDKPKSVGTQIMKQNNVVYPVMTDDISGLKIATEAQLEVYKLIDTNSNGEVTMEEVINAGYEDYVLNPDEFVNMDSQVDVSGKYINHKEFSFISTGVEWDYDDTNNSSYTTERSIEKNPDLLVDDITIKVSLSLPSSNEITGVDIKKIDSSGNVQTDIGNMIGYYTAKSGSSMDLYIRIRPDYYFSNMEQYVVKSITYDKVKDNDNNSSDDNTVVLWDDANTSNTIDAIEEYEDLYSVDGYGNLTNNDSNNNGIIDGTEVSDGIPDNQTDDKRSLNKGIYTCKNTDANMNDYTIGTDNIYSKLSGDYLANTTSSFDLSYTNTPLSGLDTMYYYGFSWNDIRYYNNGSSFALQRNINCEDANRNGVNVSLDGVSGDLDDIIAPFGTNIDILYSTEFAPVGGDLAADPHAFVKSQEDLYNATIDGQGYGLNNLNASIQQRVLFFTDHGEARGGGGMIASGDVKFSNIVINDYVFNNNQVYDGGYEPVSQSIMEQYMEGKYVYSKITKGIVSNNNYEGIFSSSGYTEIKNVIVNGVSLAPGTEIQKLSLTGVQQDVSNLKLTDMDIENYATSEGSTDPITDKAENVHTSYKSNTSLENTMSNVIYSGSVKTDATGGMGALIGWQGAPTIMDMKDVIIDLEFETGSSNIDIVNNQEIENVLTMLDTYVSTSTTLNETAIGAAAGTAGEHTGTGYGNKWNIPLISRTELAQESHYLTWTDWDTTNVADGYYPQLKTTWGMLMEQEEAKIRDTVAKKTREVIDEVEESRKVKASDTTDVSSMQKSSDAQNDIEQSTIDEQDESINDIDVQNKQKENTSNIELNI